MQRFRLSSVMSSNPLLRKDHSYEYGNFRNPEFADSWLRGHLKVSNMPRPTALSFRFSARELGEHCIDCSHVARFPLVLIFRFQDLSAGVVSLVRYSLHPGRFTMFSIGMPA